MVVPVQTSLSVASRWLTRVIAVAYLLLGLIMFAVPGWSAHHFPWKVSPFVAMTIGSYLLGSAWMAGIIQHTWTFARVYTLLLYLWLFGVLETVVVIIHRDKLAAGTALTVPYLITLGLTVVAALVGLADWRCRRPSLQGGGASIGPGQGAAGHLCGGRRIHRRGRPLRAEVGAECQPATSRSR
jgi:peptidoglycan/LPS O-acetylase OafA/YrhL